MDHSQRLSHALLALEGLSIGDALGDQFFMSEDDAIHKIQSQMLPDPIWKYTDDTLMACSIVEVLHQYGGIDQDALAQSFADRLDKSRGYGAGTLSQLIAVQNGANWKELSHARYGGIGSAGNGSAMRVASIGAYFHDNLGKVVEQATLSSEVTHANPEAIAGAIAIAVATAITFQYQGRNKPSRQEFIKAILPYVPESNVLSKLYQAHDLPASASVQLAVSALGNGKNLLAVDTVPFVIWCATGHLDDFKTAFWTTVSGLGDRDTNCAMVCGIVACVVGFGGIPDKWIQSRESLPSWIHDTHG